MKRILFFTSIRSDYDLLIPLLYKLKEDKDINLKLLVSGAHLSKTYGLSVERIYEDGFDILAEIETLIDSDTRKSRIKSASLLLQNSIDIIAGFAPDLLMYAGDREDVIIASLIGGYLNIPTAHFYGGDHVIDGNIDNSVRHAASKLSSIHFVTLNQHKERLIRMGEEPERIFVIGNVSLDKLNTLKVMPRQKLASYFNLKILPEKYAILIYHPIISEVETAAIEFEEIIKALIVKGIYVFVSYPNIDAGNKQIIKVIDNYSSNPFIKSYKNLPREIFLNLYANSTFIIGNSSSGIMEAASFKKPVVNVGNRQIGRYADKNVLFVKGIRKEIEDGINIATSSEFQNSLTNLKNSYGNGNSSLMAYNIIKKTDFKNYIYKYKDPLGL
jgi:UDP-N-acetylglucosamine 2-epimerase (non-hydrolysing)/GDP/UDP-N,N'-diacetylbacillosamine 2-epimerase (hydrolysing)